MPWRADVARRRAQARDQVPIWLQPGTFPPAGRVARVVGRVGSAVAGWYLIDRRRGVEAGRRGISRRLRHAFAALGPTYIKLGQIISGGEGLFPPELVQEFKLLRDRVPPEPFDEVRRVVELDLGRSLDDVFERFERTPIAAASIAQVHAARLRTGEEVVVKVQRPQVAWLVREDVRAMSWLAPRSSAGSRSRRSRTRPRSSSCSRKRSSRSSTSASKRRTCSTSRGSSPRPTSGRRSSRGRTRRSSLAASS